MLARLGYLGDAEKPGLRDEFMTLKRVPLEFRVVMESRELKANLVTPGRTALSVKLSKVSRANVVRKAIRERKDCLASPESRASKVKRDWRVCLENRGNKGCRV